MQERYRGRTRTAVRVVSVLLITAMLGIDGFFVAPQASAATPGDVVINEFSSASLPEWVEILNTTASPINLTGWKISDANSITTDDLDLVGVLPAGGILAFDHPTTTGWLNNGGDTMTLRDDLNNVIDVVDYGTAGSDLPTAPTATESGARDFLGAWSIAATPTKGLSNSGSSTPTPTPSVTPTPTPTPSIIYVDDSNISGIEDGSQANPFNTIQEGVNAAPISGTVIVASGSYLESVNVNKALTLQGAQAGVDARTRATPTQESVVTFPTARALALMSDNITLDGFTVQGVVNDAGIYLSPAFSGSQVQNNIIQNNTIGINLHGSGVSQTVVRRNLFQANNIPGAAAGNGIYSDQNALNILVDSNKFTGNLGTSVNFASVAATVNSNITISNNEMVNDGAIRLSRASNVLISGNTITDSLNHGIEVADGNNNVTISGNTITGVDTWSAIRIHNGGNGNITITNNSLKDNVSSDPLWDSYGINSTDPGATLVVNFNDLTNNDVALRYDPGIVVAPNTVDAQNNWWGCTTGPQNPTSTSPCGLVEGNVAAIDYNPWLATLNLTEGTPVTAQILNSDGVAVGGNTGLKIRFVVTGVNPLGAQTVLLDSSNTATYNINPGNLGPNAGDSTVSAQVLFADEDSTLTDSFVVTTVPGGGGGGGTPTPTPTGSPTPIPTTSPTPTPSATPVPTTTVSPTPIVLPGTPLPTPVPRVAGANTGGSGSGGFTGGVGGAVPPAPDEFATITPSRTPTPSRIAGQLELTPLPDDDDGDDQGIVEGLFDSTEGRNKAILASILAILAILALIWLLRRKREDERPPKNPAA